MAQDNTYTTSGPQGSGWRRDARGNRTSAIHGKTTRGGGKAASGGGGGKKAGGGKKKKKKSKSPYSLPGTTNVTPTARPNPLPPVNMVRPEPPAPIYEPGGGAVPPTQFPPDLAPSPNPYAAGSPVGPGHAPAPPVGSGPPMNPALSAASILQTVPPELQWKRPPVNAVRPGQPFQNNWVKPETLGGGGAVGGGGNPNFPFKVEPQDPNESWWRAMLRG